MDLYVIQRRSDGKFVSPDYTHNCIQFFDELDFHAFHQSLSSVNYTIKQLTNVKDRYMGLAIWDGKHIYGEYNKDDFEVLRCKISFEKQEAPNG